MNKFDILTKYISMIQTDSFGELVIDKENDGTPEQIRLESVKSKYMTKAIIFDLDGLLIDSEIISYKIYKEILCKFGYEFSKEDYAQNYSGKTEISNVTNLIDK